MTLARTPFPRKKPEVVSGLPFATKPRECRQCKKDFVPKVTMQSLCSPRCATREVMAKEAARKVADRVETKRRKEALETIPDLIKKADAAFQAWVKARDRLAGHSCISSGRPLEWGTVYCHAGHFRTKGAASALRYHPDNCHAQSAHDNKYKAGNVSEYRIRLIERIGLERVEALESMNGVAKWTHDELRATAAHYRAKLRTLSASLAQENP